jgi:hypothetical protein
MHETQALITVLSNQRNAAMQEAAFIAARLMVVEAENQLLRKQVEELSPKPDPMEGLTKQNPEKRTVQ